MSSVLKAGRRAGLARRSRLRTTGLFRCYVNRTLRPGTVGCQGEISAERIKPARANGLGSKELEIPPQTVVVRIGETSLHRYRSPGTAGNDQGGRGIEQSE